MDKTRIDPYSKRKNNLERLKVGQIWQVKARHLPGIYNHDFWAGDKLVIMDLPNPKHYNDVPVSYFGATHLVPSWAILTHCKLIG
jgi:hypothetical protein